MGMTAEQRAIIETLTGPVLVVAGVGSGKTRVLAERAAHALDRGLPPDHLLAVTFTNRAAREMRLRLADLVGPGSAQATVTTLHALCVRILRQDGKVLAIDPSFVVWDDVDSREALGLAAGQLGLALDERPLTETAKEISRLKRRRLYPQNWRTGDPWLLT